MLSQQAGFIPLKFMVSVPAASDAVVTTYIVSYRWQMLVPLLE